VGLDVACAIMTQGLTAHYLTTSAHAQLVQPGEWMLIHGVAGGTCQWAAQMAKLMGSKEIEGTSYEDYTSVDIVSKVMEITGGAGCKAVIDGIGKSTVDISIDCLSRRGIFVSFGNASGAVPPFPVLRLIKKSAFVTRPKLLDYVADRDELLMRSQEVFGWIKSGDLTVGIDKVFPLSDAIAGHEYLEAGKSKGKLIYEV